MNGFFLFFASVCTGFMPPSGVLVKPMGRGRCTLYMTDSFPTNTPPIDWSRPVQLGDLMVTKTELEKQISDTKTELEKQITGTKNELKTNMIIGLGVLGAILAIFMLAGGYVLTEKIYVLTEKIEDIAPVKAEIQLYNWVVGAFGGAIIVVFVTNLFSKSEQQQPPQPPASAQQQATPPPASSP